MPFKAALMTCVKVSPDGKLIAVGDSLGNIHFFALK